MQGILDWLSSLPTLALYLAMALTAAIENVFPPLPADTVVAFGSFLAARGQGTIIGAFLSTWAGNIVGATLMYLAGRRYGAERIEQKLLKGKGAEAEAKLRALYDRFGLPALFISRFIPGLRAIVPPFAGALRLPMFRSLAVMGAASGLWYAFVSYLAFQLGEDWGTLQGTIAKYGQLSAVAAGVVAVVAIVGWLVVRRRRSA